jgi:hypothetical protein
MNSNAVQPHLDCLIHLGAGRCSELDEHLERDPGLLVLVEADPQLSGDLERRLVGRDNARVINAGIAAESGERIYYRYNLPAVNGLRQATGMRELYPGLRLLEERPVKALGIRQLLDSLELGSESSNGLIVELAGEEAAVLEVLEAGDRLHYFCEIELNAGRDALYEDATPASQVLDWLAEHGFEVHEEFATRDPDRPTWRLRRDDRMLELRELRAQVLHLVAERDERAAQAASMAQEIETLKRMRDGLEAKVQLVEQQLDQSRRANEQLEKHLREVANGHADEFEQEQELRKHADNRAAELETVSAELREELDSLSREKEAQIQAFKALEAKLEAERGETRIRQSLLGQEMTRAEAQIDLIKDLLLHDVGI